MHKRVVKIIAAAVFVLLLGAVAVAQITTPSAVNGPYPLERPLNTVTDRRVEFVTTQVIPQGCLGNGFEDYLVVYNSSDRNAYVSIVVSGVDCYFVTDRFMVSAHQRQTYDMNEYFNRGPVSRGRENPDVSFQILSDTPGVYCELAMYWNNRTAGHTSTGFFK